MGQKFGSLEDQKKIKKTNMTKKAPETKTDAKRTGREWDEAKKSKG
jgi:hypothetical protein